MICHSSYHYVQQRSTLSLFFPQCRGRSLCIILQARDGFFVFDHMDNKTNSSSVTQREPSDPVTIKQTSVMTDSIINEPVGQLCKKSIHLFFNFNTQKILLFFFFFFFFFTQDIYKVKVHSRTFILTVTYDCMPLFTSTTRQQCGILWSIRQNCLYFSIFQTCTTLWLNKKLSYYVVG